MTVNDLINKLDAPTLQAKGTRGGEKKPGSWRVFFAEHAPDVLP